MKRLITLAILLSALNYSSVFSQNMTNTTLNELYTKASDTISRGGNNTWQFVMKEAFFISITDSTHNRMRIISPIIEVEELTDELKTKALTANFHTALDVKYAISDNLLWAVFIHPLKELTKEQVTDAINQVYSANTTFGTSFSSGDLVFPGSQNNIDTEENEEETPKEKRL